jgi:tRNA splicing endonuclease
LKDWILRTTGETAAFLLERGFGIEDGGECVLSAAEVAYVAEKRIVKLDAKKAKEAAKKCGNEIYVVYRMLRERGYVPVFTTGSELLRVHERGVRRGEDRPRFLVEVVKKDGKFGASGLIERAEEASKLRKDYFLAVVSGNDVEFVGLAKRSFD